MPDKLQQAREIILQKIENGEFAGGSRLPAVREFCEATGTSLTIAQLAFHSLTRDGILSIIPRQGTYVRADWHERILPGSIQSFRPIWENLLKEMVLPLQPDLRICDKFSESAYEIRPSADAFFRQNEYLDLREFIKDIEKEQNDFFTSRFQSFCSRNGKIYGIPLIFSPWVIVYNPEIIEKHGGTLPRAGWGWEEFLELIRTLRRELSPDQICNFFYNPFFWRCLLFRAGGAILHRDENGIYHIELDSPRSRGGLRRLAEMADAIQLSPDEKILPHSIWDFERGRHALILASREDVNFQSKRPWQSVPLPLLPGGTDQISMATDLLCVRRIVNDFEQVRQLLEMLLSPRIQNRVDELRYGIPIRRSSAVRSLLDDDPRDRAFFSEMLKIVPDYSLEWPEINRLVSNAIPLIWKKKVAPDQLIDELVPGLRLLLRYYA